MGEALAQARGLLPDHRIQARIPGGGTVEHFRSQDAFFEELAFAAEGGFHQVPQEPGRTFGFAKGRAVDRRIQRRQHRFPRNCAGCLSTGLLIEI